MLVPQQAADDVDDVVADSVPADVVVDDVATADVADVADVVTHADAEPTPPSPTPTTTSPPHQQEREIIAKIDADKDVTLEEVVAEVGTAKDAEVEKNADVQGRLEESQAQVYHIDPEHADKVLSMQDDEPDPAELKEVIEVVTTAKLMTEVVTIAATTITAAPGAARRRKGIVIRDPEETATPSTIVHSEPKSKDKGKGIMTEAQAKKNMMVYLKNMVGFKMDFFKEEEASRALKRKTKSSKEKAVKKQTLNEEVEELKKHLQIIPNYEDAVYTEATPLSLKVPVVDYQIHTENNKPYYKIIRADGTYQLFLSFLSLLRNFNREDLEPDVEAQVWKNQRGIYGLAKVKSWKLLDFGVDAAEDFKEYTLRDYYYWLKTYCCWYKLMLLDKAANLRLRLLEQSAAVDDKIKK
uniref:Uncharacterized protein n=1 Tax=Tanacetum cinerariifolium TaxID=118510 RepID=A0A699JPE2_TANCI|nr:hypothetical protein [Tanacetum cinerariifolium]